METFYECYLVVVLLTPVAAGLFYRFCDYREERRQLELDELERMWRRS